MKHPKQKKMNHLYQEVAELKEKYQVLVKSLQKKEGEKNEEEALILILVVKSRRLNEYKAICQGLESLLKMQDAMFKQRTLPFFLRGSIFF